MDAGIWVQIIICVGSVCITAGTILSKIKVLERKVEKHNRFVERIIILEQRTKVDHERINEILKHREE